MNKIPLKPLNRPTTTPSLTRSVPVKPSVKRKPVQELNHDLVRTKLNPPVNAQPKNQEKIRINTKGGPSATSHILRGRELPKSSKTLPANLSKPKKVGSNSVMEAIGKNLNKFGGPKPARVVSTDRKKNVSVVSMNKGKKEVVSNKTRFEELMKAVKGFDSRRQSLLANLVELRGQLEGSQEALLVESMEKLKALQESFQAQKIAQTEELNRIRGKILDLSEKKKQQLIELPRKRTMNEELEKEVRETRQQLMNSTQMAYQNSNYLSQLVRKKEDLIGFIANVELGIWNTKEKVKTRYEEGTKEEKRALALEELLHSKKNNFRTFLLLRGGAGQNGSVLEQETLYRVCTLDNKKRVKVQVQQQKDGVCYDFDSIYYVSPFYERDQVIFANEEQKVYKNIISSILETEQKMSFIFLVFCHDKASFEIFVKMLEILIAEHLDLTDSASESSMVQFDSDGKANNEIPHTMEELVARVGDHAEWSKENYLLTIQAKLKNFTAIRKMTFVLTPGNNVELVDLLKSSISGKNKKASFMNLNQTASLLNQNVFSFLQSIGGSSAIYAMLPFDKERRRQEMAIEEETKLSKGEMLRNLDLLKVLSRLKN